MRQIVLDTETTGLDPLQGHRVIEVACVEMINRSLTGNHLHLYINPDRDSDPEALQIHGLTTEFLSGHPRFAEVADQIAEYVKDAEIIIHNAPFDRKFLNAEFAKIKRPPFDDLCGSITDSLLYARELHPGKRNSLDALCERYGISNAHRTLHGALLDSELLAEVWLAMTRGQDALLMDFEQTGSTPGVQGVRTEKFDASSLPVIRASAEELTEHEAYLDALDKAAGKPCVWRAEASA
ncbi:DNA polymerase III subunit epsilon [Candidimonas nitroreducens]|uniref:DNA polymerase III subunit epsilon n=1 Tax=Candidimonas nitroreducens TaxID=683354 RepID=A0A225MAI0_9BURK|nr:DNA polymerase III subunit epsilon [Candidimonas nitroreducens]OWT58304.1 DNA polymerase III subunit epsilon [Candidimonas nitroreducens]